MLTNPSSAVVPTRMVRRRHASSSRFPTARGASRKSFTKELYGGHHPRQPSHRPARTPGHPLPGPPESQVHRWWHPARCAAAPTDAATTGRYTEATGDVGDDCGVGIKLPHLGDLPVEVGPLLGGTDSAATDQLWFVELSQVSVNVVEPLASGVVTVGDFVLTTSLRPPDGQWIGVVGIGAIHRCPATLNPPYFSAGYWRELPKSQGSSGRVSPSTSTFQLP